MNLSNTNLKEHKQNNHNNRDITLDIAKGFVIILVVLGHTSISGSYFIFLFHMPFFFALAGYLYKEKYFESINNIIEYIKKKFNRLLTPFLFFSFLGLFLHNILVRLNMYQEGVTYYSISEFPVKILWTILCSRIETITSPCWFLKCLFFSLLLITLLSYISKKTKNFELSRFILILFISLIGFYCYLHDFNVWLTGTICSSVLPVYAGILLKKSNVIVNKPNPQLLFYTFLILFTLDMILKQQIKLYFNFYYNPILLAFLTITGFIFVYEISLYLTKFKRLTKVLAYLGRHTISILCLHILSFKLVIYLQYVILNKDISVLNSYPAYLTNNGWFIIYLTVGIAVPLLLNYIYDKIKCTLKTKFIRN